jgi:CubicO group peptidase (beta-lactamase class C family)
VLSGGGGLVSTTSDYVRFTRMLARGGELDGVRILSPRTLGLMTRNHLEGDLAAMSTGGFAETSFEGVGFGLGSATVLDPTRLRNSSTSVLMTLCAPTSVGLNVSLPVPAGPLSLT